MGAFRSTGGACGARRPILGGMDDESPFVCSVHVMHDRIEDAAKYPFSLPPVRALDGLELATVTYFIGENGCGKSTILEALAVAMGFNAEGGTVNFNFATRRTTRRSTCA